MVAMKKGAVENYPLEPLIVLDMSEQPVNSSFSRDLAFQDHTGLRKRVKVAFRKTRPLRWESDSFPNGLDTLRSLVDTENRSYWDGMVLENRGSTTLHIQKLQIIRKGIVAVPVNGFSGHRKRVRCHL
jgi:hypothetical protein